MTSVCRNWDEWLGDLVLKGADPRRWDLHAMLAAYETALQQGAKDESAWRRLRAQLYTPPKAARREAPERASQRPRTAAERPATGSMTLDSVEAMLASAAAADARYGAS